MGLSKLKSQKVRLIVWTGFVKVMIDIQKTVTEKEVLVEENKECKSKHYCDTDQMMSQNCSRKCQNKLHVTCCKHFPSNNEQYLSAAKAELLQLSIIFMRNFIRKKVGNRRN